MNHEMIREAHTQMRALKEHWWHEHDEPDPPPCLFVKWRDHEVVGIDCSTMASMIVRTHEKFPKLMERAWGIPETGPTGAIMLWMTLGALADGVPLPGGGHSGEQRLVQVEKGTPMEHILFNVEGWGREVETPDATNLAEAYEQATAQGAIPEHGDMEKDFKENPNSDVKETMTTYIVQTDALGNAEWYRACSMFHKDDGGVIVWHDVRIDDSEEPIEVFDPLIEVMKRFVQRESLA
jgi:hypothetical protein